MKPITCYSLAALLALAPAAWAAGPAPDAAASAPLYNQKCAVCHGADGAGHTILGRRYHADLLAKKVQKKSNAELARIIAKGKPPHMAAFGDQLSKEQIEGLVAYIRHLAKK